MKFINVTDKNFEDIFLVSAKYEQWQYVKHHIFDMVNNYAAIINQEYLPIPFLVYENNNIIGFVQINYFERKSLYEIRKLIVHETEQSKGYGTKAIQLFMDYVKKKPLGEADGIVLSVVEGNNVALKLYESFGFKVIGEDKYGHIAMRH